MMAWAPFVFIGADSNGTAIIQCCWGGTSLASPLWAGYSRVLAAASDNARLGLLNVAIYKIANAGLAADGIEDVVSGNNSYNGVTGYTAGPGYDQVTGWGSVDMTQFASAFTGGPPPTPTASATATPTATATASATPSAIATQTPVPSALTVAPTTVKFGRVALDATSDVQMVTLSHQNGSKAAPITLDQWNPTGDFSVARGLTTCAPDMTLRPGQKCKIALTFNPTLAGARSGTLTIQDNASNNRQVVQLKGTGK